MEKIEQLKKQRDELLLALQQVKDHVENSYGDVSGRMEAEAIIEAALAGKPAAANAERLSDLMIYPSPHGTLVRLADVKCRLISPAGVPAMLPEGWRAVPLESTSKMDDAGLLALPDDCTYTDAEKCYRAMVMTAPLPDTPAAADAAALHPDDAAVDRFAAAMKVKMAASRAKGRGGWDDPAQCPTERLQAMLVEHLAKGDPVDVGNFAMMLFCRGDRATATSAAAMSPALMRQAVASVVSRSGDDLRIAWLRPERCDVGTLLYCAVEQGTPAAKGAGGLG